MIIISQSETTSIQSGHGEKPPRHAKTLIAIPATQYMPTRFVRCLENLRRLPETYTSIIEGSVIHDSRNEFASIAIQNGFDRVLCIDSDMTFTPDLLTRLSAHLDSGKRMVCGLYFKRVLPTEPVIYHHEPAMDPNHGEYIKSTPLLNYPRNTLFQIDACGFGAVMMDVSLLREVWDHYGPPFTPYLNLGEDLSFCWRVRQLGVPIWCDSTIRVGHLGQVVFSEETYLDQCSLTGNTAHNQKEVATQSGHGGPGHSDHNRIQPQPNALANNQPNHKEPSNHKEVPMAYYYSGYADHMLRIYCRNLSGIPDNATPPVIAAWTACHNAISAMSPSWQSTITDYYSRHWDHGQNPIDEFCRTSTISRGSLSHIIRYAQYAVCLERGLIDRNETRSRTLQIKGGIKPYKPDNNGPDRSEKGNVAEHSEAQQSKRDGIQNSQDADIQNDGSNCIQNASTNHVQNNIPDRIQNDSAVDIQNSTCGMIQNADAVGVQNDSTGPDCDQGENG